jgi:hypothetical protein
MGAVENRLYRKKGGVTSTSPYLRSPHVLSLIIRPWTMSPLNYASLERCVPWTMRSLDDASLGLCVPWTMRPLDYASLVRCVPWTMRALDEASPGWCTDWTMRPRTIHLLGGGGGGLALCRDCRGQKPGIPVAVHLSDERSLGCCDYSQHIVLKKSLTVLNLVKSSNCACLFLCKKTFFIIRHMTTFRYISRLFVYHICIRN